MTKSPMSPFEDPDRHARASEIIRRCSTNVRDVREAVLDGLDLSFARRVLDLGCGFGFMTEVVARRVAADAVIVGVDACAANEGPYLERVAATGRVGEFVCRHLESGLEWADAEFDVVVASYALYFFPRVLPEVARVLQRAGAFVAVTHTESSCRALLRAAGLQGAGARLLEVIGSFSADNAEPQLARWFEQVRRIDYENTLVFERDQYDDFLRYLWFKLPFLTYEAGRGGEPAGPLADSIRAALSRQERVVFDKGDSAFHCWRPRCG